MDRTPLTPSTSAAVSSAVGTSIADGRRRCAVAASLSGLSFASTFAPKSVIRSISCGADGDRKERRPIFNEIRSTKLPHLSQLGHQLVVALRCVRRQC